MISPIYRTVCEKCGRITHSPLIPDMSVKVYRDTDGADIYIVLCPEHKAELERLISNFLEPEGSDPCLIKIYNGITNACDGRLHNFCGGCWCPCHHREQPPTTPSSVQ